MRHLRIVGAIEHARTPNPGMTTKPRIAVIGAGLSGLTLAHRLADRADIVLFEKARGPGGRIATRYADPYRFDHGAQFFTARTEAFRHFLEPHIAAGTVARWDASFVELTRDCITAERNWDLDYPHYVAVPGMNALGRALAEGLDLRLNTRVERIRPDGSAWRLEDEGGETLGEFDWVVSTAPAEQAASLLPEDFAHAAALEDVRMLGCYSLMLGFADALPLSWQAGLVKQADISWISVNSSKPGRADAFTLLVHATNAWADAHIDDHEDDVTAHLLAETSAVIGHDARAAEHVQLHRWRYANIGKQSGPPAYVDDERRLAACGDWCLRGRIESAFTSASALSDRLVEQL